MGSMCPKNREEARGWGTPITGKVLGAEAREVVWASLWNVGRTSGP